jgi:phosphatidylethanolamine/phosphatidyl-N-methylethanolamine N-methyltransferase
VRFFRQWLREPRATAALAPSGRELARQMAAACGANARSVVELGGGTGAITEALLERGIRADRLLVLERNPELYALLMARFPEVEIVRGDAFQLVDVVAASAALAVGKVDAVASGLGLVTMSEKDQRRLLGQAFDALRPTGRFVQFTYLPRCPLKAELRAELGLEARRVSSSLRNLPPAFVYVLRRKRR